MVNNMWIIYALLAAFFAGITAVFAKMSLSDIDSSFASSLRTIVILLFFLILVLFKNLFIQINDINLKTFIFLILSGISTTLLWIFYFKALKFGNINSVASIDKTSIVITLILSSIFLNEKITIIKIISSVLIIGGTLLMNKKEGKLKDNKWIIYAILTALFTSTTTIFGKIGLKDINTILSTLIRTFIVFILIWLYVIFTKKYKDYKKLKFNDIKFICLSGLTTGLSWLFYYAALQKSEASLVFPIEKLNILFTVIFSYFLLKEKINKRSLIGLFSIIIGTIILIF